MRRCQQYTYMHRWNSFDVNSNLRCTLIFIPDEPLRFGVNVCVCCARCECFAFDYSTVSVYFSSFDMVVAVFPVLFFSHSFKSHTLAFAVPFRVSKSSRILYFILVFASPWRKLALMALDNVCDGSGDGDGDGRRRCRHLLCFLLMRRHCHLVGTSEKDAFLLRSLISAANALSLLAFCRGCWLLFFIFLVSCVFFHSI